MIIRATRSQFVLAALALVALFSFNAHAAPTNWITGNTAYLPVTATPAVFNFGDTRVTKLAPLASFARETGVPLSRAEFKAFARAMSGKRWNFQAESQNAARKKG